MRQTKLSGISAKNIAPNANKKIQLIAIGAFHTIPEVFKNRRSLDHTNNSIIKIEQTTEKSPGDLRKLLFIRVQ